MYSVLHKRTNLLAYFSSKIKEFNKDLKQLKESFLWSGYPNYIIDKYLNIFIKRKRDNLQNCSLDVPQKQVYFGFQYINKSSVKFVQNISKLISKYFNYIKCIPYFTKGRIYSHTSLQKSKNLIKTLLQKFIEFHVTTVLNATLVKQNEP